MTHPTFSHIPLPHSVQDAMIDQGVWKAECPVSMSRLSLVQFSYHDFQHVIHYDGSVVVLDILAPHVENIFRHLFLQRFPLYSAKRIENFGGSDEESMVENNSSAFNYRAIAGTKTLSLHGYGAAIDINPVQNPCLCNPKVMPDLLHSVVEVWPTGGMNYLNRSNQRLGMVEPIVDVFAENGFREWGGTWNELVDYHHFQVPRYLVELLVVMPKARGDELFRAYVTDESRVPLSPHMDKQYVEDPEGFMDQFPLF
jgi:hypothetical protein